MSPGFFFFFFIYFYQLEANYFTILWWFLPYIDMNQPWIYMCSPSQFPLQPPSPSHPSGSSQCLLEFSLGKLSLQINLSKNVLNRVLNLLTHEHRISNYLLCLQIPLSVFCSFQFFFGSFEEGVLQTGSRLGVDGETVETVADFIFLGSKIIADGNCSHEIKRRLLFGRKVMTNLDSILNSRDITLPAKVHLVKAMVFPVVMYGCESWTIKKAERQRIDAFELWCWRRLLRVPSTERRSNQFILKEISPECSLEGLMLKLKLQHFGHLMRRADSSEKTLMLGGIEGRRRRG